MRYAWNRSRSVDAQLVGERVASLAEVNGGVCPAWAMVDEARLSSSPLHPMFEWNDWTAAEAYRREQARHHIRELRIVPDEAGEEPLQAFVHVIRVESDGVVEGYRLTSLVVESQGEYEQVLTEAKAGLVSWQRRYRHLSELREVFGVIARVI